MKNFAKLLIALYTLGMTSLYAFLGYRMFEIAIMFNEIGLTYRFCAFLAAVVFSLSFITSVIGIILSITMMAYIKDYVNAKLGNDE